MPTVIDSLIVRLGLDSKGLDSQAPAGTKKLKDIETQATKSTSSVDSLTRTLGTFLALIGGTAALKSFIEDTIASNAALDRLSKNLGLAVEDISAWGNAVEGLGGSAKGLQGTMDMLSKAQTEFALTGQSSLIPYFSALGVSLGTVGDQARPVDEILLDLSERFSHMDRPTANNMGRMMGLDQDTLNLLLQGRKEVELTIARQKEYNAVTKAQAEESSKLQRSMIGLKQSFAALGRDLLQQASPALEKFLGVLKDFGNWIGQNKEFIRDFAIVLGTVGAALGAIALVTSPITLTVAAVLALAAAIALLWQDYQTWKRGGDSFVDWGKWLGYVDAVTGGIKKLRDEIGHLEDSIDKILNKIPGFRSFSDWFTNKDKGKSEETDRNIGNVILGALGMQGSYGDAGGSNKSPEEAIAKIEGMYAKGKKANRPQRNHNPGNIEYGDFAKRHGATGTDGRFAIFPDDKTGFAALSALLRTKKYSGMNVEQMVSSFAPPGENDTEKYIADFDRQTGANRKQSMSEVLSGIQGASSNVAAAGGAGAGSSTDKSVTVQTGDITVNTQATDANGIARDIGSAMQNYLFTSQATSGAF